MGSETALPLTLPLLHILFLYIAGSTIQRRMTTTTTHPPLTPLWSQEWWSVVSRWVGGQRNKRPNHLELLSSWVPVIFYQYNLATWLRTYLSHMTTTTAPGRGMALAAWAFDQQSSTLPSLLLCVGRSGEIKIPINQLTLFLMRPQGDFYLR